MLGDQSPTREGAAMGGEGDVRVILGRGGARIPALLTPQSCTPVFSF